MVCHLSPCLSCLSVLIPPPGLCVAGRCIRLNSACGHQNTHRGCQDKETDQPTVALQGALHWVWGDLVEVSGTHERVLHHCGLHETQPCRSVCHKVPQPICHLGRSSHLLLVVGVAAGVHEVTVTGRLPWKPVCMVLNEIGDQREGRILCTLSRDCSRNDPKLLGQR